jgi:hypothetical protein
VVAEELKLTAVLEEDERLAHGFDRDALVGIIDCPPRRRQHHGGRARARLSATISKVIGGGRVQIKKGGLARVDIVERVGDMVFGVLVSLLTPAQLSGE